MALNLGMLTFDCADVLPMARFWSAVVDRPIDDGASEGYATVSMG